MQLAAQSHGKIADIYHLLYFAQSLLEALAHFIAHQCTKIGFVLAQGIADLSDDFSTLWCWGMSPSFEGFMGSINYLIIGLFIGKLNGGNVGAIYG
jgi:hypothetical protein